MNKVLHIPVNLGSHLLLGNLSVHFSDLGLLSQLRLQVRVIILLLSLWTLVRLIRIPIRVKLHDLTVLHFLVIPLRHHVSYWPLALDEKLLREFINGGVFDFCLSCSLAETSNANGDIVFLFDNRWRQFLKLGESFILLLSEEVIGEFSLHHLLLVLLVFDLLVDLAHVVLIDLGFLV